MNDIIKTFIDSNKTISTMESCTGGYLSSTITNYEDSSLVFKFGAITYSNEYKIKMGVNEETISEYTEYSINTANEMSRAISKYTNSNYGIGITGKLNKDINDIVYISIYDEENNKYYNQTLTVSDLDRTESKKVVVSIVLDMLKNIIK